MSRNSQGPWFRTSKNAWYVTHEGRRLSLGVTGKASRKAALAAWQKLLKDGPKGKSTPAARPETVSEAVTGFLTDAEARTKASTHGLYQRHLATLTDSLGAVLVESLTALALARWLHGLGVSTTTQAITLRSVSAFLGWCVRHGFAAKNATQSMTKPKSRSRGEEAVISQADHEKLMALATPQFRSVLSILHATGARPGEVCKIAADNFDPDAGVVKLAEHKSDRTGRIRLIFLPAETVAFLKAEAQRYRTGPLLRNGRGRPWTPKAIAWALNKLREKAKVKAIAYGYRHGYATEALAKMPKSRHFSGIVPRQCCIGITAI